MKLSNLDDDILAIGSGGNYAFAAAKAMTAYAKDLSAAQIALKCDLDRWRHRYFYQP